MGYYVTTTEVDFVIEKDKCDAALAEMKRINGSEFDHLKHGGSWGPDGVNEKWYSWMPTSFDEILSIAHFFEMIGFEGNGEDLEGNFALGFYDDKTGDEGVFFEYLAPFVRSGSYIEWRGEDGEKWRWLFEDGKVISQEAKIVWA